MDNMSVMLIKPLGDHTCSVDGGYWVVGEERSLLLQPAMLAIIIGNQACAACLYMTLSMLGCYLLNEHMSHTYVEAFACCPSFTQVFPFLFLSTTCVFLCVTTKLQDNAIKH